MPTLHAIEAGSGPGIVLVHGVGVGVETFAVLAADLAADHRVVVIERPGSAGAVVPLVDQADQLAQAITDRLGTDSVVVGVSGGATLALLVGMRHPGIARSMVAHEPLVGPLAPDLHQRFAAVAERADRSDDDALAVVRAVMGPMSWTALDRATQAIIEARAGWVRAEVPLFAEFAPTAEDLAGLRSLPLLVTVGGRSEGERHAAADVLADLAGASVATVPDAGNAVQLDAPASFAATVRTWNQARLGCRC